MLTKIKPYDRNENELPTLLLYENATVQMETFWIY
jgi:hypothetical protein